MLIGNLVGKEEKSVEKLPEVLGHLKLPAGLKEGEEKPELPKY